eukprot:TRINITY_DN4513_c0_g1_i10.p1 TRINITY_DN4513_c0_g1~~TRINITY_DN4513_c0_g1_i10.p1  ORF type:complete len:301 (+),score=36.81 TRINITY_DN4513_c0_g1_i10:191-1093(+)
MMCHLDNSLVQCNHYHEMSPESVSNTFADFDFDNFICYGNDDDLILPNQINDNNNQNGDSQPSTRKSSYEELEVPVEISDAVKVHINKFMSGEEVKEKDLYLLNDYERCVVKSIQIKKTKPKTKEQNNKQVMRPAFKKLQDKFFRSQLKKPNKKKLQSKEKDQNQFYEHYFGEIKNNEKISIENFYQPIKKSKKGSQRTYNQNYLKLTLKSQSFREDLLAYVQSQFLEEQQVSRDKKIDELLKKCRKLLAKLGKGEKDREVQLEELKKYILNNSKMKLPWSNSELNSAKKYFETMISQQS